MPSLQPSVAGLAPLTMPLHPLFVHGAVVFLPLAALLAIAVAVLPRWRWVLRLPSALVSVLALVFLMASRLTGDPLAHQIRQSGASQANLDLIEKHDQLAGLLTIATFPMVLLALLCWWALPASSPLPDGRWGTTGRWTGAQKLLAGLTVLLALAVVVLTILTGDAGAKAVWTS